MYTAAEARVIASFTFIVALLFGAWGAIDNLVAGPTAVMADSELARLAVALTPFVATGVAYQATKAAQVAWAKALGGAAVMLGVLVCFGAVLYFRAYT
jgi:hypothetical protein